MYPYDQDGPRHRKIAQAWRPHAAKTITSCAARCVFHHGRCRSCVPAIRLQRRQDRCKTKHLRACGSFFHYSSQSRPRLYRTMSPVERSWRFIRYNSSVSPGLITGSILEPLTFSRKRPDERKTSPANSHLSACVSARNDEALMILRNPHSFAVLL